ncbi:UDP-N-acetylmuramoyl-L-alanyl-D-glutamate--2,6-diaminopimelate ligase [Undibacterium sp. Jales W-56]|uniref:UDP-N-acetylmuramoyl-L-alanyl-D-glutamate--2, 6-diaminopimelate ligase n=1 Tax=Undibacterium sp. Jales W-56 TaxID=2897325 RepID=UPI0021D305C9|nr:UDP-N-acetylmuramoyl-L-alanyl-D-glutamate--2,6-diaminopimelate ligase [Undibacterium sp. Jales W-56]MCU6432307.1 UDP-N-acetylmuramoyl-L-alanyl-D-glutamate--2,6-diaminopimelate ligase [Undibacterium sp. Jales W-56]
MTEILKWLRQLPAVTPRSHLSSDSRAIVKGDVFFAFPISGSNGVSGDGRRHIQNAVDNGAVAVVYEADNFTWDAGIRLPHLAVAGLQGKLGSIANAWYAEPDRAMLTVAVTGTNGKTSCSQWLAKALSLTGKTSAVIGTLGVGNYKDGTLTNLVETGFTTPDAIQLQRRLADLRDAGAKALAIEASSIGLHQGRLNGLHVDVALLTNLTRDHLDYHGDMATYAAAKTQLFDWPDLGVAVLNLDDAYGVELVQHLNASRSKKQVETRVLGYSLEQKEHDAVEVIYASNIRTHHAGTSFHVDSPFGSGQVKTQMIGRFNVSNVLGVLSVLLATGVAWSKAVGVIEKLTSVPGRMQQLGTAGHVMVVIDYAHTPDALEKTVQTLQQVAQERHGELWCVFGCGGDRDPGKRPQMGRIAEQAQHVVVTSDNPRTENPADIIAQILKGMSGTPQAIEDRASAILYAIKHAGNNDVVLLAGKGHENYQDIHGKKWPFSDEEHAALALATIATSGNMKRSS